MRGPAYHLRPNKAVDRLIFMEAIQRLERVNPLKLYTYYGFGGPYLEDFRLLYERYPDLAVVSIEQDEEVVKRQRFHVPSRKLSLKHTDLGSFVSTFDPEDRVSIFWLDYTNLTYGNFNEFSALLAKLTPDSLVKVTLQAKWRFFANGKRDFAKEFGALLPSGFGKPPRDIKAFVAVIQNMLRIASERALPAAGGVTYQPLCTFYYSDGTFMFTATGLICERTRQNTIRNAFAGWKFAALDWADPVRIDVPILTTKERLHLQKHMPRGGNCGRVLRQRLGYLIDKTEEKTESQLAQYERFHRYYPYVMRALP